MNVENVFAAVDEEVFEQNRIIMIQELSEKLGGFVSMREPFVDALCNLVKKSSIKPIITNKEIQFYVDILLKNKYLKDANINLQGSNLSEINFANAHLKKAWLTRANFAKATFYKTNLNYATLNKSDFHEAEFRECLLKKSVIDGTSFEHAKMYASNFAEAKIIDAYMTHCDMYGTGFVDAKLNMVHFDNSDLSKALFKGAHLKNVTFKHANLTEANFEFARFTNVDLEGANLSHVKRLEYVVMNENGDLADEKFFASINATLPEYMPASITSRRISNIKQIDLGKLRKDELRAKLENKIFDFTSQFK